MGTRDWSIQEIARLAGTTSRTLRHYDDIGLLPPSRIAANGYRHYDEQALVRLQRILLLRELGLGLPQIAQVLAADMTGTVGLWTDAPLLAVAYAMGSLVLGLGAAVLGLRLGRPREERPPAGASS